MTDAQLRSIALIADGHPYRAVAATVGVELRDLVTWVADPEYREALEHARASVVGQAAHQLSGQSARAVESLGASLEALEAIRDDPDARAADRIRACAELRAIAVVVMDRVGLEATSKVELQTSTGVEEYDMGILSDDELDALGATLERMRNGGHEH